MKLLLKLAFDGKDFHGSQAQPGLRTVQGVLTESLSGLIGRPVNVTGCSRTDSGVHAEGYVVSVTPRTEEDGWLKIPAEKFHLAANNVLPGDISVTGAFIVNDDDFHPRYSVVGKKYVYRIYDSPVPSPFLRGRVYEYGKKISDDSIVKMDEAAKRFEGRHDFTSFMASGSKITDATREVFSASVARCGDVVEFTVFADGFLYNMVRIMSGTLLDVAKGKTTARDIPEIISVRDRAAAGETLPPEGLYLKEVIYPIKIDWLAE
ncbi:MAG: tRNA pseudouridine(38-40) synthase TruA [Clostridia bacterium]|nr:tRNA pseudouridine(38-40) synthase TruA [Clostridia bacterium]